jgi:hypothetical protein
LLILPLAWLLAGGATPNLERIATVQKVALKPFTLRGV